MNSERITISPQSNSEYTFLSVLKTKSNMALVFVSDKNGNRYKFEISREGIFDNEPEKLEERARSFIESAVKSGALVYAPTDSSALKAYRHGIFSQAA
jgi:hypothetical protein